jgi:hypothetical protein
MWKKASVVAGLAALAMSSTAWAGWKYGSQVVINTTGQVVGGSFGGARNSTDANQYIDIGIQAGAFTMAYVYAADASGNQFYCAMFDPDLIALVSTVTSESYIQVSYDNAGHCTNFEVRTSSPLEPKQP